MTSTHTTTNPQNTILMNRYALTLILAATLMISAAGQPVQFTVNMEHTYLAPGDQVVVRGNVPQLGDWEAEGQLELRQRGQSGVYQGQVRLPRAPSQQVLYKFVIIRTDGTEQWEEIGNRVLDTSSDDIPWFENRDTPGITQTIVSVTFRLDLTRHGINGYPAEGVALMGGQAPLSFELETGRREMTQVAEGIWEVTIGFPHGTPHDVPFKFAWQHEGEWRWEWRPGHTNHVFLIDDTGTEQTVHLVYDLDKPGVVPSEASPGFVDDYPHVLSRLGERAAGSRYQYELAMQQLRAGHQAQAEATYAAYTAHHPGGDLIDDFYYELAHHLNRTQGEAAAEAFISRQLDTEAIPERRAYFGYLRGEIAFRNGNHAKARQLVSPLSEESGWEMVSEYSRVLMVESYLREPEPDSVKQGVRLLERYARQAPQAEQRAYTVRLERAYLRADMPGQREEAMQRLTSMGNAHQQGQAKLRLAERYTQQGRHSEAMGLLDAAEFEGQVSPAHQPTLLRLRMEAYYQLDMDTEFAQLYQRYQAEHPDDVFQARLERMNRQVLERSGPPQPRMEPANADSTDN